MNVDSNTINSINRTFNIVSNQNTNTDVVSLTKSATTNMSNSLTKLQNKFNEVITYTSNATKIQDNINKRGLSQQKNSPHLEPESDNIDQRVNYFQLAVPKIIKSLKALDKGLKLLDLHNELAQDKGTAPAGAQVGEAAKPSIIQSAENIVSNVVSPIKDKATSIITKGAIAVGAGALGFAAFKAFDNSSNITTPSPVNETNKSNPNTDKISNFIKSSIFAASPIAGGALAVASSVAKPLYSAASSIYDTFSDIGSAIVTGGKAADMEQAIDAAGIKDPVKKAQIMAQTAHESGDFRYTQEIWGPNAAQKSYEGRKNLGNVNPGDGSRYRGRGFLQTTGRSNYAEASKGLGVDFVNNPEKLAEPKYAAASAMLWFSKRLGRIKDWSNTTAVTKVVNGGSNGLSDRKSKFEKYLQLYKGGGSVSSGAAGVVQSAREAVVNTATNVSNDISKGRQNVIDAVGTGIGNVLQYAKFSQSVNFEGLKDPMKKRFTAMAAEHTKITGKKITINSGYRSYEQQAFLFKTSPAGKAARPGRSRHEEGLAIDINSSDGDRLLQMGLLQKYGFTRPVSGEKWHIEPIETASRVGGAPDNPFNPGQPIIQAENGKVVKQDGTGKSTVVTAPKLQLGAIARAAAITTKTKDKAITLINIVQPPASSKGSTSNFLAPVGGGGIRKSQNVNTAAAYKYYFNAA